MRNSLLALALLVFSAGSLGAQTRELTDSLNGEDGAPLLTSANRVWVRDGLTLRPEFSVTLLSNYESGRNSMSAGIVRAVCEIYRIPPSWLLGIDDELYHKSTVNGRHVEIREKSPSIASPLSDIEKEEL